MWLTFSPRARDEHTYQLFDKMLDIIIGDREARIFLEVLLGLGDNDFILAMDFNAGHQPF